MNNLNVKLIPHAHDQLQVMVGRRRVAYVAKRLGAPINFLEKAQSGLELTTSEKIEVATTVREYLPHAIKKDEDEQQTLDNLTKGNQNG